MRPLKLVSSLFFFLSFSGYANLKSTDTTNSVRHKNSACISPFASFIPKSGLQECKGWKFIRCLIRKSSDIETMAYL